MCTASEFWTNFCLDYLHSATDTHTGRRSISPSGVVFEICIFFFCFRIVAALISEFIHPAVECLSLRKRGMSEVVFLLLLSALGSFPELGLSVVSIVKGDVGHDQTFVVSTVLGVGWISILIIPCLATMSGPTGVNASIIARDIICYGLMILVIMLVCLSERGMVIGCTTLILLSGVYFGTHIWTQEILRTERLENRQRRLKVELQPLESVLRLHESLDRLPVELAYSRGQYLPLHDLSSEVSSHDALPDERRSVFLGSSDSHNIKGIYGRIEETCLRAVCVRSLPGTDSERLYLLSLLNACILLLFFSSIITAVCDRWITFIADGFPSKFVGPILVSGVSKLPELMHASSVSNSAEAARVISSSLTTQVLSLMLCVAIPWLLSCFLRGETMYVHIRSLKTTLTASFVAVFVFISHCIYGYRNGIVHFNKSISFLLGYVSVLLVFTVMTVTNIHS
jgi:Ca2+/Na+ antiporter